MESSSLTSPITPMKRPYALLEHSVIQFNDVLIPHRLDMLKKHKININKCLQLKDFRGASKEQSVAAILIQNLSRDLMDMEALRNQVQDVDRLQFDKAIAASEEKALQSIREFMYKNPRDYPGPRSYSQSEEEDDDSGYVPGSTHLFRDAPQITLEKSKGAVLSPDEEAYIKSCEKLQADIEDLNAMFMDLNDIVKVQSEALGQIEENITCAHEHVSAGHKNLQTALKYKSTMYPVLGAALGTIIGGPIGLVVGLKTGAGLAVGGSVLGFVGGKILKRKIHQRNEIKVEEEKCK